MARVDYERRPLVLPFYDGEDNFKAQPCVLSKRLDAAERFRRNGKSVSWAFVGRGLWGKPEFPLRLSLDDASPRNKKFWYRGAEPIDMTAETPIADSQLPTSYWKWRVLCEPANLPGNIGFVQNPSAPPGQGASIMAEDLITKEGVLSNLPNPFSAPFPNNAFTGNLQYGTTDDGGTTIYWSNPIWN